MRLLRVSRVAMLMAACVPGIIAACANLDGLSSAPATPDAEPPEEPEIATPDAEVIADSAAIPTLDPDVVVNPSAGLGAYLLLGEQTEAGMLLSPILVDPMDGATRSLACPITNNPSLVQGGSFIAEPLGPMAMRVFYDPKDPSKGKLIYPTFGVNATMSALFLVDQSSGCEIDGGRRNLTAGIPHFKQGVSFSDDGARAAFLVAETVGAYPTRLVTVAADGPLDQFELRNTTSSSISLGKAPPAWVRDPEGLKLAWVELDRSEPDFHFVIRLALDKAITSAPPILLDCGSIFFDIFQIGVYKGTGGKTFLAFTAQLSPTVDGGVPSQRGIFSVDYLNSCQTRTLTFPDVPSSSSYDFAIAPDGDRMAHVSDRSTAADGGTDQPRIWIGSVMTRKRTVCSAPPSGFLDQGPQWLAGGDQILWTRRSIDRETFGAVPMIADVAGDVCSGERPVMSSSPTRAAFTPRNGCAVSGVGVDRRGALGGAALPLCGLVVVLRRRRSSTA